MSREFTVVTTCSHKGWLDTGERMVRSLVERWRDVRLVFYAEDFDPSREGIETRRLPGWFYDFRKRNLNNRDARGMARGSYDFRRDALRFAFKTAATIDAAESMSGGVLVWADADVYTHEDVTPEWLDALLPAGHHMAWLERDKYRGVMLYPECGFVMYDSAHPGHAEVIRRWRHLYESDQVLKMRETHDSFVLWKVVEGAVRDGVVPKPASLSGRANNRHHPFVAGPLGAKMDHLKGARKRAGKSYRTDYGRREEEYWRR